MRKKISIKFTFTIFTLSCLLAFSINAAIGCNLRYEVSGNVAGTFTAVYNDPLADLLNVDRNSVNILPFKLQLLINPESEPFVGDDTSILRTVAYADAIVEVTLELNGIPFRTLRRPNPCSPSSPCTSYEGSIGVAKNFEKNANVLEIIIQDKQISGQLFNTYTVPFNQTISGTLIEDVNLTLNSLKLIATLEPELMGESDFINTGSFFISPIFSITIVSDYSLFGGYFLGQPDDMTFKVEQLDTISGDILCDGVIDLKDIIMGLKILSGVEIIGVTNKGDINNDGIFGLEEILFDLNFIKSK